MRSASGAILVVCVWVATAYALPDFLDVFGARYGVTGGKLDSCAACHAADVGFNSFGRALESELTKTGSNLSTALSAIESQDSDGDGHSNIDEIRAGTWPGDPTDFPAVALDVQTWTNVKRLYRPMR